MSATAFSQSGATAFRSVPQHVARNPVARAVERARLRKARLDTALELAMLADWEHAPSILCGVADAVAMAIKAIEGMDDPDYLGDAMVDAMDALTEMSGQGFVWRVKHREAVINAFEIAVDILMGTSPQERLKAWAWSQAVARKVREEVAA